MGSNPMITFKLDIPKDFVENLAFKAAQEAISEKLKHLGPSLTATLKMGIENMLKHYIPEIREVRAV